RQAHTVHVHARARRFARRRKAHLARAVFRANSRRNAVYHGKYSIHQRRSTPCPPIRPLSRPSNLSTPRKTHPASSRPSPRKTTFPTPTRPRPPPTSTFGGGA